MNRHGRTAAIAALAALVVSGMCFAGWTHFNGKTFYVSNPTEATIWQRYNYTGNLHLLPNGSVQVFDNTIHVVTGGVSVVSYGYWRIDANGNYVMVDIDLSFYTNRRLPGSPVDCEFEVDGNGNVIPKEYKR